MTVSQLSTYMELFYDECDAIVCCGVSQCYYRYGVGTVLELLRGMLQ